MSGIRHHAEAPCKAISIRQNANSRWFHVTRFKLQPLSMEDQMAFIKLASQNPSLALAAGKGIIALSESVFNAAPNSEWAKFVVNPHQWLYNNNYRHVDKNYFEIGDGKIPQTLELVPVYDTASRMHVTIPWKQSLRDAQAAPLQDEPNYQRQFPAVLAHYFMRKCR
jgi:hypothetical protein